MLRKKVKGFSAEFMDDFNSPSWCYLPGREVLPETLGRNVRLPSQTIFMTKLCNIPYPIYGLANQSKPCFERALS